MAEPSTTITVPPDVLFHELDGEAVLLNLKTGKYYGLNEIGARLWGLLVKNPSLDTALQTLLEEYEVDDNRLRQDILRLIEDLAAQGLVEVQQERASDP